MNQIGSLRIAGYAALFDIADGAQDTIRKGAFARSLAELNGALPLFWQHKSASPARRRRKSSSTRPMR